VELEQYLATYQSFLFENPAGVNFKHTQTYVQYWHEQLALQQLVVAKQFQGSLSLILILDI